MKKTEVVNKREQPYQVYIGRGSKWGNPFHIGKDGNRYTVCDKHNEWIKKQQYLLDDLGELLGKTLGCFCRPDRCHGITLLDLLEEKYGGKRISSFVLETEEEKDDKDFWKDEWWEEVLGEK